MTSCVFVRLCFDLVKTSGVNSNSFAAPLGRWQRLQQSNAEKQAKKASKGLKKLANMTGHVRNDRPSMPKAVTCIKDSDMYMFINFKFQPRRVALTTDMLYASWLEGETILDMIPLRNVISVAHASPKDWADPLAQKEEIEYYDSTEKKRKTMSRIVLADDGVRREFKICTQHHQSRGEGAKVENQEYVMRADSEEECTEWISLLREAVVDADKVHTQTPQPHTQHPTS